MSALRRELGGARRPRRDAGAGALQLALGGKAANRGAARVRGLSCARAVGPLNRFRIPEGRARESSPNPGWRYLFSRQTFPTSSPILLPSATSVSGAGPNKLSLVQTALRPHRHSRTLCISCRCAFRSLHDPGTPPPVLMPSGSSLASGPLLDVGKARLELGAVFGGDWSTRRVAVHRPFEGQARPEAGLRLRTSG